MKKIFLTLLATLSIFGLAACGGNGGKTRKTVVTYCGWDLGTESEPTLKRQMINKWNETNEKIYIEVVEPQGGYDEFINTMASAGNLADVFLVNSVPNAVVSKQAMDITNFAKADTEWETIEGALRESVTFSESIYAIPAAQNYIGFFANYKLLDDEAGLSGNAAELFEAGKFSYTDFFDAIKAVNNVTAVDGSGFIGVNATGDMINWLPSSIDSTLETPQGLTHYVWNGESLDMNGTTMLKALEIIQEIGSKDSKYTFNSLAPAAGEEDTREQIFGSTDEKVVFEAGKMAFIQAASYYTFNDDNMEFEYKFVAYPDAKVISAADYLCISKATAYPDEAFEVAKYLTYGAEGINARYEIVESDPENMKLTGLPIVTDATLTANWFEYITLPGVKEVYNKVVSNEIQVIVECNKATPGYLTARFNQLTGVVIEGLRGDAEYKIGDFIWDVCGGDINLNQYRTYMTDELEAKINKNIKDAYADINKVVAEDLPNRVSPKPVTPEGETPAQ